MKLKYYKRNWDGTTGEPLTDSWGTSIFFFETNEFGEVLRQIELFENGKILQYDKNYLEDEYGGLSEISLELIDFEDCKIVKSEFEIMWNKK